jgi:hypothetical protein
VIRFSALLGFRDSLKSDWEQPLLVCTHSATRSISQSLRGIYGRRECNADESTDEQGKKEKGEGEGEKEEGEKQVSTTELLVVLDDVFHPGLAAMLEDLTGALAPCAHLNIKFMVAFDSVSIVPFRSLVSKFQSASREAAMSICKSACHDVISLEVKSNFAASTSSLKVRTALLL